METSGSIRIAEKISRCPSVVSVSRASAAGASAGASPAGAGAGAPAAGARSGRSSITRVASARTVEARKSVDIGRLTPRSWRMRAKSRTDSSEWPPTWKKSSSGRIASPPRSAAK